MTGRATGLRPRPQETAGPPVTVLTSDRPPEWMQRWMQRWCRSTGRTTSTAVVPATERVGCAVPEFAARAARAGAPVLLLREPAARNRPPRVVAAVQRLPEDAPVVEEAARCAAAIGARLQLVHAVPTSFGEQSVGLAGAVDRGHDVLAQARRCALRTAADVDVDGLLVRARPHEAVGERLAADLLVIGGPRPGTARALGLVALSALQHAPCPVLLVPRGTDGRHDRSR